MENSDSYEVLYQIIHHLDNVDCDGVKQLLDDQSNASKLREAAWDLVPKVTSYVTKENSQRLDLIKCCEDIFLKLCEVGNAKEILLVLLEQIEASIDDITFVTLLEPLRNSLQSLKTAFGHSLTVTLETLYGYLASLPLPDVFQIEDEERKLLDSNEDVRRITHVVNETLLFLAPFIPTVKDTKQKREVIKFLIQILDHPLGHLDLMVANNETIPLEISSSRVLANKLMGQVAALENNFSSLIGEFLKSNERLKYEEKNRKRPDDTDDDLDALMVEEPVPPLGLAVFSFLAITDPFHDKFMPQVLTSIHWIYLTKDLLLLQLKHNNMLVKLQGVATLNRLLSRCNIIASEYLEWNVSKSLIDGMILCISTSHSKQLSRSALQTFTLFYMKCQPARRFKILYYLYTDLNHSGMIDYVTGLLKKDIDENLKQEAEKRDSNFIKPCLNRLLKIVFILAEQEKTDLLENSERILGALNLLRYLVVRDKPGINSTGVWTLIDNIQSGFIEQLQVGINMSRAHYQLDIDKLAKCKGKRLSSEEMEVSVGGQVMAGLSVDQKLDVLQTAVYRFDMMESVLSRVRELIDQANKH